MTDKKSSKDYIILFFIINIIAIPMAWFIAQFTFVEWQNIPDKHFTWDTLLKYSEVYGHIEKVKKAVHTSWLVGIAFLFVFNALIVIAIFIKPKRELHGSARFANDMEIRKAGFLPTVEQEKKLKEKFPSRPSVIIGKYKGKFLQFYGNEFVSIGAPTRSGKGVSIVIPNLLTYPDSIVVLDVKMENWELTAGFRAKYQDVYLFAPKAQDGCSHCYNPLDYIQRDELLRMSDIQNLAQIFYPADDPKDAFWQNQAQRIFTGLVLYMLETPERPCTMSELIKLTTPISKPLHEWIPDIINQRKSEQMDLTVECVEALMAYVNVDSDNTRSSILATLMSPLNIFTDPAVAAATSRSDFRLDEVRKKKMTIYVGVQPNELSRFSKLLNVLFSQLINLNNTLPEHNRENKYQCLVLLDEFTSLGRVEIIQKSIAYIAGYNMRLMPIFQSRSQVEDAYGRDGANAILSNIACQVEFTPTELDQAEMMSKKLGTQTVKSKSVSRNRGKGGGGSVSTSDHARALLLPQELLEMPRNEQIIFFREMKAIKCEKAFYYANPQVFASRMQRMEEPPQGLPIPQKHQPPKLDLLNMLKVMRGVIKQDVSNYHELKPTEYYEKEYPEFLEKLGKSLGFDEEFFDELDKIESTALENFYKKSGQDNSVLQEDDDENIVFDLSDTNEFDQEFIDEFNF